MDISAYALDPRSPGKHFEEIAQPQCEFVSAIGMGMLKEISRSFERVYICNGSCG